MRLRITRVVLNLQTTAALTQGLERIPDQLGYLVISEEGVLAVGTHPCRYMSRYCLDGLPVSMHACIYVL